MKKFTLDTNCLIALAKEEPAAGSIRALVHAHCAGSIVLSVVAISASERQKDVLLYSDFSEFENFLAELGLATLSIINPMGYYGISFYGHALYCNDKMKSLERGIHSVLFPNYPYEYSENCHNIMPPDIPNRDQLKWRNRKCDVQMLWSHIYHSHDVFVTKDTNFHNKSRKPILLNLGAGAIEYPEDAASMLRSQAN